MYSASYGYPNAAAGGPNFNSAPPQPGAQNLHMQPGHVPGQPPQQMMYNQQQFAMAAASPGPYPGVPNMLAAAGPGGMMQNSGAIPPHIAANGQQMSYQTPYTSAPYGAPVPSPPITQPQIQPNFGPMLGSMAGYPMGIAGMPQPQQQPQQQQQQQSPQQNQQQHHQQQPQQQQQQLQQQSHMMQQRMLAQQNGPGGPQRMFSPSQVQPNQMSPHQPQFSPQQAQHGVMSQNPQSANAQPPHTTVTTPQTPTFPNPNQGGAPLGDNSAAQTPLSPGTESREKQRFQVLLEINAELMYEAMELQNTLLEHKKENDVIGEDGNPTPREQTEDEKKIQLDYVPCMKRLQTNLAFMATLVDPKATSRVPYPMFLSAPTANLSIKLRKPTPLSATDPNDDAVDPQTEREERSRHLKDLYGRLQALYPGVDPTKEPGLLLEKKMQAQNSNPHHHYQLQQQQQARPQGGGSNQASPAPVPAPASNRTTPQMTVMPTPG